MRVFIGIFGAALCCVATVSCSSGRSSTVNGASAGATSGMSAGGGSTGVGAGGGSSLAGSSTTNGSGASAGALVLLDPPDSGDPDGAVLSGDMCGSTCPAGGTCSPETCDGVDNNCDGIVDNVDKNGDGVCDCLLIATLGVKGNAGTGDVFAAWLSARSNNGATSLADQILTPQLLAGYQVIVVEDVSMNHLYADTEVMALSDWVKNGGGLMTLTGYSKSATEIQNVNTLLAPFTMDYAMAHILPRVGNSTVPITMWTPHPIDTGVTAVGIDNGYAVEGMGTTIATGGGFDVAKVQEVGRGHVFVWGDEWITYNSEWQSHPDYQVELFWVNAIKWLTAVTTCQVPVPTVFPT